MAEREGITFEGRREALTYKDWRKLGWEKPRAERLALDHEPRGPRKVVEAFLYCDGERMAVDRPIETNPDDTSQSPTRRDEFAFEWGYHGQGPHETARAILGRLLPSQLPVPWVSQQFKQDAIAKQPMGGFTITEGDVGHWAEWVLVNQPPPPGYPQARSQLEELARRGRKLRRESR